MLTVLSRTNHGMWQGQRAIVLSQLQLFIYTLHIQYITEQEHGFLLNCEGLLRIYVKNKMF